MVQLELHQSTKIYHTKKFIKFILRILPTIDDKSKKASAENKIQYYTFSVIWPIWAALNIKSSTPLAFSGFTKAIRATAYNDRRNLK